MPRFLLLFLLTPVAELYLLIQLGKIIGLGPTLALILTTALIGSSMARREGLSAWQRFQEASSAGRLPGIEIVDGIIILISGAFLLTPGIITDVLGFLGLIPPTRRIIRNQIFQRLKRSVQDGHVRVRFSGMPPFGGGTPEPGPARDPAPAAEPQRRSVGSDGYETTFGGAPKIRPSHPSD